MVEPLLPVLDIGRFFSQQRRVFAEEMPRGKPHPDPYLEGLRRISLTAADNVLVFEESPTGMR